MKLSGDLRTLDATIQTLEEYEKKRQEIVAKVERLQVEEAALRAEIDSLQQEMRRIDCRPGQRA
jgi:outer membrane murein-binding lipoprotein Lpp